MFEQDLSPARAGSALLLRVLPGIPLSLHPGLYAAAISGVPGAAAALGCLRWLVEQFLVTKIIFCSLVLQSEIVCTAQHELSLSKLLESRDKRMLDMTSRNPMPELAEDISMPSRSQLELR